MAGKKMVSGTGISEILADLDSALEQFRLIANDLGGEPIPWKDRWGQFHG
jgi:hypothetical protein